MILQDKINMHLNNAKTNFLTDVDKLKKDKDLEHNFGQGATNIFQVSEEDNCDDDDGLDLRFYIPDEAVAINSIKMRWGRKSFRAYSLSVCGGGGVTETTTNDGGFSQTSDGDISPTTITSFERVVENALGPSAPIGALAMVPVPDAFPPGGSTFGYTQFTGNVINQTGYDRCVCAQLCFLYFPTLSFVGYIGSVSKMMANGSSFYFNGYTNTEYSSDYWIAAYFDKATCGLAPSDTIGLSAQSILNHTHITTVGDHTHKVTIPNHTHQICYGIYEPVSEDNVCVDVFVDTTGGTPTHTFTGIPVNYNYPVDIELSSHITTVGWHCIYLQPQYDDGTTCTCHNARLHANAFAQVYIESK